MMKESTSKSSHPQQALKVPMPPSIVLKKTKKTKKTLATSTTNDRPRSLNMKRASQSESFPEVKGWEVDMITAARAGDVTKPTMDAFFARQDFKDAAGNIGKAAWEWFKAPFHNAAFYGRNEMVTRLVEVGVDVNSYREFKTTEKVTALFLAVSQDHISTVKLLLDLGADPALQENSAECTGSTLDCAKKLENPTIVNILEEHVITSTVIKKIKSKPTLEEELKKSTEMQEKIMLLKRKREHYDVEFKTSAKKFKEDMLKADERCLAETDELKKKHKAEKKVLREACDAVVKEAKANLEAAEKNWTEETVTVDKVISALEKMPECKSETQIQEMKRELQKLTFFSQALQDAVAPNISKIRACNHCGNPPVRVFSCGSCEYWVCGACVEQVETCPKCEQDFKFAPMLRNKGIEGVFVQLLN